MRSFSAPAVAALNANEAMYATLVRLDFPSGTIALNSSMYPLVVGGITYQAGAGLGSVAPIEDVPSEVTGVSLQLQRVDASYVALALDDADEVQGSQVTISTAIIDKDTHQVLEVEVDWTGYADTMPIARGGKKANIGITAESKAVDLLRGTTLVYNDADQQSLVPGDRYFEYVVSQSDKPVAWPTKEWFFNK